MTTMLIVGLGNPGSQYDGTRHNLGFVVVDRLKERLGAGSWKQDKNLHAHTSMAHAAKRKIVFAKPQTFMNESGKSVQKLCTYYKVEPQNLWVVHDDLDLPPGTIRTAFDSRAAGHNGVQSVIDMLGTQQFHRVRIGIGSAREHGQDAERYVLERIPKDNWNAIEQAWNAQEDSLLRELTK